MTFKQAVPSSKLFFLRLNLSFSFSLRMCRGWSDRRRVELLLASHGAGAAACHVGRLRCCSGGATTTHSQHCALAAMRHTGTARGRWNHHGRWGCQAARQESLQQKLADADPCLPGHWLDKISSQWLCLCPCSHICLGHFTFQRLFPNP